MKATASPASSNNIATTYNRFPRLSPDIRNTILSAALEARKHEEETKKQEREILEEEQARAMLELKEFLCVPPRVAEATIQGSAPDTVSIDLIELH